MNTLPSTIPAHVARDNFYQILEEAGEKWRQFKIRHREKPDVVVMSAEEFESWQETVDIMSNKKLVASITRARKSKKVYTEEQAKRMLGL